jgi:hypothetical protein
MFGWWRDKRIAKLKRRIAKLESELAEVRGQRDSVNERLAIKGREADFHAKVAAIQQAQLDGLVKPEADA